MKEKGVELQLEGAVRDFVGRAQWHMSLEGAVLHLVSHLTNTKRMRLLAILRCGKWAINKDVTDTSQFRAKVQRWTIIKLTQAGNVFLVRHQASLAEGRLVVGALMGQPERKA